MRKFGFKFFSTNFQIAPEVLKEGLEFAQSKDDMFLEISAIPTTTETEFKRIKDVVGDMEVRIHAGIDGFNAGDRNFERENKRILAVAQKAADIFKAQTIVVHPGDGHGKEYIDETVRQFRLFNDERIVVENLPYLDNEGIPMHGSTAEEIAYIMKEVGCGFCFDFSHATCAALSLKKNIDLQMKEFFALNPRVYHMCDGDFNQAKDKHLHFGEGNYPLKHYLNDYTAENAYITMETGNGFEPFNELRIKDYEYLKALQNI